LGKTELDVKRYTPLARERAISQEDLDNAIQSNLAAQAAVVAAKAEVAQAELNLGFTRITAPIDGIAGIATGQIGDLVAPTSGNLTTVSTVDPIRVYISMSEQEYLHVTEHNVPLDQIPLELFLADGSLFPKRGTFFFADRQVNERTGTIRVAALFENTGNLLRPGQFARVRAVMATKKGALLVPQRAVAELQDSFQVAVVGPDNRVEIRPVKPAERVGTLVVIEEGLKPGERVVVEGISKMKPGMLVAPRPFTGAAAGTTS
jgi:RND family efflux transporter MFP subunit